MKFNIKIIIFMCAFIAIGVNACQRGKQASKKMSVAIISGSTRKGRSSDKIANALNSLAHKRSDVIAQLIDLRDYQLPFLNDEVAPAMRTKITDPAVQKWSDAIKKFDAFIIVSPEYNGGYPGVLKNALDSLYAEWNNKPIAFVVYSGGPSGGSSVLEQLRQVANALGMVPVAADIKIANSWKAFDTKGKLIHERLEDEFEMMMTQLMAAQTTKA